MLYVINDLFKPARQAREGVTLPIFRAYEQNISHK